MDIAKKLLPTQKDTAKVHSKVVERSYSSNFSHLPIPIPPSYTHSLTHTHMHTHLQYGIIMITRSYSAGLNSFLAHTFSLTLHSADMWLHNSKDDVYVVEWTLICTCVCVCVKVSMHSNLQQRGSRNTDRIKKRLTQSIGCAYILYFYMIVCFLPSDAD